MPKEPNRLIHEASPYLQQHAYNPVDWYPWGEEALEKAKQENKPIFLSIGYSTCHWCHNLARESFSDETVAALLNEHFVAIKVDREERPDIDAIYMNACQAMTGHGGWPLSIFMTPGHRPFYAGTYFPPVAAHGLPSFADVVKQLAEIYENEPDRIEKTAGRAAQALQDNEAKDRRAELNDTLTQDTYRQLARGFDPMYGGFQDPPKFPQPHNLFFLLRYYVHTKENAAKTMAETTLEMMARGGIYDQLGGGFARYSVDNFWQVPHFEKMLYDNALLAMAYIEGAQVTGRSDFRTVAEDIFAYLKRDMQHPDGAFYAAEDADSEGAEGTFYVFTPSQVIEALGEEDGPLFNDVFGINEEGNFHGASVPNLLDHSLHEYAEDLGENPAAFTTRIAELRDKLFTWREKRTRPHRDEKILTSWNALTAAAFAKGAQAFQEPAYAETAAGILTFLETNLYVDGRWMARYREGDTAHPAFLDDYANLVWAYQSLYEATMDAAWLTKARRTADELVQLFWDGVRGGFYFYGSDQEALIVRPKETFDGAMPAGNSVAAVELTRLARKTGEMRYARFAESAVEAAAKTVNAYPHGHTHLIQAKLLWEMGGAEIVVASPDAESLTLGSKGQDPVLERFQQTLAPHIALVGRNDADPKIEKPAPFTSGHGLIDEQTAYYVCRHFACHAPTTDAEAAWRDALRQPDA
ncbi:hypothetical protein B0H94_104145 [Salsuginibacillus halophilus]|uniref:Spermatogenesis-associated protein 20-like TRX domain-containing protein n=1 Tax=Salsuginibacillus halophilus TaxID=517424 RepID=A0A2P8HQT5_9BACI|nr:thioredoxin domain-containing protein [Salsuginibacillus halophilus]PSL48544.1 hypothetical protein B0H94_104145 [Salsuginibacillus halophilus]